MPVWVMEQRSSGIGWPEEVTTTQYQMDFEMSLLVTTTLTLVKEKLYL